MRLIGFGRDVFVKVSWRGFWKEEKGCMNSTTQYDIAVDVHIRFCDFLNLKFWENESATFFLNLKKVAIFGNKSQVFNRPEL